jgi:hypothetical protein
MFCQLKEFGEDVSSFEASFFRNIKNYKKNDDYGVFTDTFYHFKSSNNILGI